MAKAGFVAIIGRPNAGKSTLLNRVLGTEISIVTPKAQTTRDKILGIFTEPEGQIVFIDTPGIHKAREGGINEFMVQEAKDALEAPNLVWYLVDPASAAKHEIAVLDLLKNSPSPVVLLINKMDRPFKTEAELEILEKELRQACAERNIQLKEIRKISAEKGRGVKELVQFTWGFIPEGPAFYPDPEQVSDRPTRFFVAEKIREQLFHCLGDELPYSCAVEIEKFEENKDPVRIEATIHVERDSQKGMVIGQGGKKIKEIGQNARGEIEDFLGIGKIFLGLRVKVLKDWTRNSEQLKRMGYYLPERGKKRSA